MVEFIEKIEKTRQYLSYLEEHYKNVQKAWKIVKKVLNDIDDNEIYLFKKNMVFDVNEIEKDVIEHDLSKLSINEFIPYREKYYPTEEESKYRSTLSENYKKAWRHHYKNNRHHIENSNGFFMLNDAIHCYVDWLAMSLKFNNDPIEYYKNNLMDKYVLSELLSEILEKINQRVKMELGK